MTTVPSFSGIFDEFIPGQQGEPTGEGDTPTTISLSFGGTTARGRAPRRPTRTDALNDAGRRFAGQTWDSMDTTQRNAFIRLSGNCLIWKTK